MIVGSTARTSISRVEAQQRRGARRAACRCAAASPTSARVLLVAGERSAPTACSATGPPQSLHRPRPRTRRSASRGRPPGSRAQPPRQRAPSAASSASSSSTTSPRRRTAASSSSGVGPCVRIATAPPAAWVSSGSPATGWTSSEEPMHSSTSARSHSSRARSSAPAGEQLAEQHDVGLQRPAAALAAGHAVGVAARGARAPPRAGRCPPQAGQEQRRDAAVHLDQLARAGACGAACRRSA